MRTISINAHEIQVLESIMERLISYQRPMTLSMEHGYSLIQHHLRRRIH